MTNEGSCLWNSRQSKDLSHHGIVTSICPTNLCVRTTCAHYLSGSVQLNRWKLLKPPPNLRWWERKNAHIVSLTLLQVIWNIVLQYRVSLLKNLEWLHLASWSVVFSFEEAERSGLIERIIWNYLCSREQGYKIELANKFRTSLIQWVWIGSECSTSLFERPELRLSFKNFWIAAFSISSLGFPEILAVQLSVPLYVRDEEFSLQASNITWIWYFFLNSSLQTSWKSSIENQSLTRLVKRRGVLNCRLSEALWILK